MGNHYPVKVSPWDNNGAGVYGSALSCWLWKVSCKYFKFSASPVLYSTFQLHKVTANLQAIKTHLADLTGTGDALMASSGPRVSLRKSYYSHLALQNDEARNLPLVRPHWLWAGEWAANAFREIRSINTADDQHYKLGEKSFSTEGMCVIFLHKLLIPFWF